MLDDLQWTTLYERRKYCRSITFYKFLHQDSLDISIPEHYLPHSLSHFTRLSHHLRLILGLIPPVTSSNYYQKSFLNQARAGRSAWFLKIDPVRIVGMRACVCVCVSAPEAINN